MQSKISYFNMTLFRKNLSRFWPLWGGASFLGALFPLALWLHLARGGGAYQGKPLEFTATYYSVLTNAVPIISLLYAILCAMVVWSYLYNARSVGMMHTLPLRREGIFATNFLSGMAMMLLPYAITGALCVLLSLLYGSFDPVGLLNTVLGVLGMSFFYFASATFAAFVTGNVFALPALYFLFHFLAVLLEWLLTELASDFLVGVGIYYNGSVTCLSPTVYLMQTLGVERTYGEMSTYGDGSRIYRDTTLTGVRLENFWLIGIYALVGAALLALAYVLYRRRRSESAGDVVAVGWMRPVFRYGAAALAALLGGRALYALFWESFQSGDYINALPMAVCMTVAGVIGYYGASMLLAKSLRVFHGNWQGIVLVAVGCAALCGGLRYDVLGFEKRVPEAGQVEQVSLYASSNSYELYAGEDDALIEEVLALHRAITDDVDRLREPQTPAIDLTVGTNTYLRVEYTLTNGKILSRSYHNLCLTADRMEQAGTYDQLLDALVNSEAMKAKRLHVGDSRYTASGGYLYQYDPNAVSSGNLSDREAAAILAAVGQDAAEGTWGQVNWFNDDHDSAYALELSLDFEWSADGDPTEVSRYDTISIVVRPEMAHTLDCLDALGLIDRQRLLTWGQYNRGLTENQEEYGLPIMMEG